MRQSTASLLTLARRHGRGGFSIMALKVYPNLADGVGPPRLCAADRDIKEALAKSPVPSASLLVQTIAMCRPTAPDPRIRDAGRSYAARVGRKESQLVKLAIQAAYQWMIGMGQLPDRSRRNAAPSLLKSFGISPRMRNYWGEHSSATGARALINKLVPDIAKNGDPGHVLAAISTFYEQPVTGRERRAAGDRAYDIMCAKPPVSQRERRLAEKSSPEDAHRQMLAVKEALDALLDDDQAATLGIIAK